MILTTLNKLDKPVDVTKEAGLINYFFKGGRKLLQKDTNLLTPLEKIKAHLFSMTKKGIDPTQAVGMAKGLSSSKASYALERNLAKSVKGTPEAKEAQKVLNSGMDSEEKLTLIKNILPKNPRNVMNPELTAKALENPAIKKHVGNVMMKQLKVNGDPKVAGNMYANVAKSAPGHDNLNKNIEILKGEMKLPANTPSDEVTKALWGGLKTNPPKNKLVLGNNFRMAKRKRHQLMFSPTDTSVLA